MSRRVGYGDRTSNVTPQRADGPWTNYLTTDERILWEGWPVPGAKPPNNGLLQRGFGLFFLAFSIFWTFMASSGGAFALFGLPFIAVGVYMVFGKTIYEKRVLASTVYALSNKNCFIATNLFSRKLKSYPITRDMVVELLDNDPGSVVFAEERVSDVDDHPTKEKVGFIGIKDASNVFRMLREVQEGMR